MRIVGKPLSRSACGPPAMPVRRAASAQGLDLAPTPRAAHERIA
ncbi:hypothetical protein DFR50_110158 [Roseiarcus fermentans]|uniref:Uncharacterized protein n=1 Tax=Roseiarcus fermentans TaxID=1473586 RepID=A0A366FHI4_9HYPH|nr:hypothetical protein DFR50_110158 [Roseiarcus fermentans]